MARRRGKTRTRTITKTRFRTRMRGGFSRLRHRMSSGHKMSHVSAITQGVGVGSLSSIGVTLARKNGAALPTWASPVVGLIIGLLTGKMSMHSWGRAAEVGITSAITAYVEDRVISGQPILGSVQSGGLTQLTGGSVY